MSLFLIVALPFLGALLPGLFIRAGRQACYIATVSVTATAFLGLMLHLPAVLRGEVLTARLDWLPALGLNVNLFLDPLGFMFAALILGIGLLIVTYARWYLSRDDNMGEFYTYLLLFQGAMVGIVLSDNILMLLVFWELTSLSSFLLIGFWKHLPDGRQGARMALTVTGGGGLALIGGMLILGQIAGSYDLTTILQNREIIQASPLYVPALLLILLGCFTKSAQFPFHFWLPHAMSAPTPVSAYLHSATMVKAGLFLMARLWPVLSGTEVWVTLVCSVGLITMMLGAFIAFFKDDLKALLAFSTVSHLGLICFLLGTGTTFGAMAAVFHILNHASFKAALFMVAGIVDHGVHTRDMRKLGGLRHAMPITFVLATLAGLSMAGIPLLNGFVSKEMMLEEATYTTLFGNPLLVTVVATLGALFSAAYSFRLIGHTFLGAERHDYPAHPHDPKPGLWLPPALLMVPVVALGLFPFLAEPFVRLVTQAVVGDVAPMPDQYLALWHGLTPALAMSGIAVVGGAIWLALFNLLARVWHAIPRPEAKAMFDATIAGLARGASRVGDGLHDGNFSRYAAIFVVTVVAVGAHAWFTGDFAGASRQMLPVTFVAVVLWGLLIAATASLVALHRNRLMVLIVMGLIGLIVSFGFNYFSAPDLALTQITVEVVTIILLLLALNFLPRTTPVESGSGRRLRDGIIAIAGGVAVTGLVWTILMSDFPMTSISAYQLANSYYGGGGTNVVNVILVDFRGYDTFGEIIVLGIAALVIFALTETLLGGPVRARLLNRKIAAVRAGDPHPMMMVVLTRVTMPVIVVAGIYIFLRGHNEPGGGFVAGLVVSIAVVMQYMASGITWAEKRQRFPYHGIIGAGVLIAGITGMGAFLAGFPFLTSSFGYFRLPPLQEFELATAIGFDLGVFLAVLGAVMLSLESFARLGRRSETEDPDDAMGIDPSRILTDGKG
ncbi:multisubunit potassium/proton antiporter, PhaA subunit /multisubunit potassium/proton antiporter, PhaB subunit [Loktanella fryxellensis]|uniref:Multisubunit potassium/proton antiporter, PhaA subunit /multisubunit potassium/proton antiporter, PhaB subunit n=1 Tax=Loktanella fryxellensis TaxID=245187 RepID=A0A1H8EF60_9RHOB|nr:monovalent cation/H+ antiporter subunit A [Loktanella fryxellensis]SEN17744.1 multisubunit potassium/proton antiporter, PhaA subunit /multisubunit potassium/proton antiporter, PhaB subunit [Loktanella fryxellensis]